MNSWTMDLKLLVRTVVSTCLEALLCFFELRTRYLVCGDDGSCCLALLLMLSWSTNIDLLLLVLLMKMGGFHGGCNRVQIFGLDSLKFKKELWGFGWDCELWERVKVVWGKIKHWGMKRNKRWLLRMGDRTQNDNPLIDESVVHTCRLT